MVFGLDLYPADAFRGSRNVTQAQRPSSHHLLLPPGPPGRLPGRGLASRDPRRSTGSGTAGPHDIGFYNGGPMTGLRRAPRTSALQEWADKPMIGGRVLSRTYDGYRTGEGTPADHAAGEPLGLDLIGAAVEPG